MPESADPQSAAAAEPPSGAQLQQLLALALQRADAGQLDEVRALLAGPVRAALAAESRAHERAGRLQTLAVALSGAATPAEVYEAVLRHGVGAGDAADGASALRAYSGTLFLYDDEKLTLVGSSHAVPTLLEQYRRLELSAPVPAAEAVRAGAPIWISSQAEFVARYPHLAEDIRLLQSEAAVSLPMAAGGRVLGVLNMTFAQPLAFGADERGFLLAVAELAAQALERSRLLEAERTARQHLEETTAVLGAVLGNLPLGLALFDRDRRLTLVNQQMSELNRMPSETLLGRGLPELAQPHPEARHEVAAAIERVLATGQSVLNQAVAGPDPERRGGERHLITSWFPVTVGGEVRFVGSAVLDVTDRQLAEHALRESEARFRAVHEAAIDGFMLLDAVRGASGTIADFRWRYANAAAERIIGKPAGWFVGREMLREMPGNHEAGLFDAYVAVVESGEPWMSEVSYQADGVDVFLRLVVAKTGDGIAVSLADLSERRQMEQQLRASEATLRATLDALPVGVIIADADGRITRVNAANNQLWGLPPETTSWEQYGEWVGYWPATGERIQAHEWAMARALLHGEVVVGELVECEQFGTGERRFFLNNAAPIRDASGRIIGGVVAELDVTSRRHAEEQLQLLYVREQAARASAEEASRLKDEFLATVSHELRTPLTAFLGHAQLLQTRKRDEAYVARTIEKMVRSASAQARLIEDLLDVSRIVTGNLRIEREPVDLLAIVGAAIDTVRPTLEARELQLQAELDPAAGAVVGDANRLQQVAWNLLANAAKFTPQGGTIAVRLARRGDEAELQVRDNGRGISPAFLPHVFERFRQADSSSTRSYNGLGLGLAIVRHLVELHGGSVAADSAGEDQGATFTVRLPLAGAADARALDSRGPQREPQQDSSPTLSGLRVLLVDDEEGILELLHDIFAFCGADVRTCTSARAALALLQGWRPAVLISDIAMPGEDGYWLIRAVRALRPEDGGATPAVALTAYARPEDRHQILEAGFQLYVPKPVEPRALCELVADLVAPDAT